MFMAALLLTANRFKERSHLLQMLFNPTVGISSYIFEKRTALSIPLLTMTFSSRRSPISTSLRNVKLMFDINEK